MSGSEIDLAPARPRRSMRAWLLELTAAIAILTFIYTSLQWFSGHYRIVFDAIKGVNCLPYSVFLIDLKEKRIGRGELVAFISQQMEPFYKNGTAAVKLLAGLPGDHIVVDAHGVAVNGQHWGELLHAQEGGRLWKLGRRPADYFRDEQVPAHQYWVLGTLPRSYDSRYWGYIADEQVLGRAIPLW